MRERAEERERIYRRCLNLGFEFCQMMKMKQYEQAKRRYEDARSQAVKAGLSENEMEAIFGKRGERGVILKIGAFPEGQVIKMLEMTAVRNQTENK